MPFKVANVICRFNSGSGGPPRTVALIGRASLGHWSVELFTTDYLQGINDKLLTSDFPGHVNVMAASAQRVWGGMLMVLGGWSGYEVQLVVGTSPKIVHIHGVWTPYLVAFARAAKRHGIPYIIAPHGMLEPWSLGARARRKALALRTYQGPVLAGAAAIHATSEMEAENLRRLPWIRAPIHVIPNAVELPPPGYDEGVNSGDTTRTLLFLSRVHRKKGLDLLLRAWSQLRPTDWRLLIVGNGEPEYLQQLQKYCITERVPGVEFHPHVDGAEREAMFARAAATVLPTYSENFGNIVAESLVRALPVITTTGTPWLVVREKRLGWYVEPEIGQLTKALGELFVTDPGELHAMGVRGREYALTHLTTDAVRGRLMHMYESVMRLQ